MSVWFELPPEQTFSLENAIMLADAAHRSVGQLDKGDGGPYIRHPLRVMRALEPYGPAAEMAGVLHDVPEDTGIGFDDLEVLQISDFVIGAVDSVSKRPGEPYRGLIQRAKQHPMGRLVKLADNRDNGNERRLAMFSEDRQAIFRSKYSQALIELIKGDSWLASQVPLIQARIEALFELEVAQLE